MKKIIIAILLLTIYNTTFSQTTKKTEVRDTSGIILNSVEVLPQFPGGMSSLSNYLSNNIRYPAKAREEGREGKVIVQFVVCKDGSLCNETIMRSPDAAMSAEVLRVVKAMPNWKPGKQNGEAVKVYYTLPVTFKLDNDIDIHPLDSFLNKSINTTDAVLSYAEQMPEFPGGEKARAAYISKNLKYPNDAIEKHYEGAVYVKFVVETDGTILFPKVIRSIGGGCDEEAVRLVKAMPKWLPGKANGKAVRVLYTLPVKFELQ